MNFNFEYKVKCPRCDSIMQPKEHGFDCKCGLRMIVQFVRTGKALTIDADYDVETKEFKPRRIVGPMHWDENGYKLSIRYEEMSDEGDKT